ncbi:MAG: ComEC/Rec2 family competence protein [Candidatus Binatia bacterium]
MTQSAPSLTILDVGHGSCTILTNGARTTLIDTGPGAAVLEYLLQEEISVIDVIVLSHADEDHIRGLIALLGTEEFGVRRIQLNSDAAKTSEAWQNLAYEVDELRRVGLVTLEVQLREGDMIDSGIAGLELRVLAPRDRLIMRGPGSRDRDGRRITSNSISAVILVRYADRRVALITGDLDEVGLVHLVETNLSLAADVLVFPHHGGLAGGNGPAATAFARKLTSAVDPECIAISLGRGRYANPRPEIVEGMRQAASSARIACTQLSKDCASNLPSLEPAHLLPLFAGGAESRSCCAGTMRIELEEGSALLPDAAAHGAFIDVAAPTTALCRRRI